MSQALNLITNFLHSNRDFFVLWHRQRSFECFFQVVSQKHCDSKHRLNYLHVCVVTCESLAFFGSRGLLLAILADRELSLTLFVISFDWLEKCYATFAMVPPLPPAISPLRWHLYITAALAGLLWWTPARMRQQCRSNLENTFATQGRIPILGTTSFEPCGHENNPFILYYRWLWAKAK